MPRRIYTFDRPDDFFAATVGQPGQRAFFLHAAKGGRRVSVALEKVQVAALADRLEALIAEVERRSEDIADDGEGSARPDGSEPTFDVPADVAFQVGTMALGWDGARKTVMVEARAITEEDDEEPDEIEDDDPDGPDLIRVFIPVAQARAFSTHAGALVSAGRPPCPVCGEPLDPQGHICARRNGYLN
jgi:uncharacterized repeat protein (TIGR03847 family)